MARMVATKAALSIRVDALTDADGKSEPTAPSIGVENRGKLESRLRALEHQLEGGAVRRFAGENSAKKQQRFQMTGETKTYNIAADQVDLLPTQRESISDPEEAALKVVLDVKEEKRKAKEERKAKKRTEKEKQKQKESSLDAEDEEDKEEENNSMDIDGDSKKKKDKKRKRRESDQNGIVAMDEDAQEETSTKVFRYVYSFHCQLTLFTSYSRKKQRKRERQEERPRKRRKLLPLPLSLEVPEIPQRRKRRNLSFEVRMSRYTICISSSAVHRFIGYFIAC